MIIVFLRAPFDYAQGVLYGESRSAFISVNLRSLPLTIDYLPREIGLTALSHGVNYCPRLREDDNIISLRSLRSLWLNNDRRVMEIFLGFA